MYLLIPQGHTLQILQTALGPTAGPQPWSTTSAGLSGRAPTTWAVLQLSIWCGPASGAGGGVAGACRRRAQGGRRPRPSAVREAELAALQPPRRRSAPHSQQWRLRARAAAAAPGAAAAPRAPWGPRRRATRPSAACRVNAKH